MCQTIAEGGMRCAADTGPAEATSRQALVALAANGPTPAAYEKAYQRWQRDATAYASTPEGQQDMSLREKQAEADRDWDRAAELHSIRAKGVQMRAANEEAARIVQEKMGRAANGTATSGDNTWACGSCGAAGDGEERACPNCQNSDVSVHHPADAVAAARPVAPVAPVAASTVPTSVDGVPLPPNVQAAVDRSHAARATKQAAWANLERLNAEHEASGRKRRSKELIAAERAFDQAEWDSEYASRDVESAVRVSGMAASEREIMLTARSIA